MIFKKIDARYQKIGLRDKRTTRTHNDAIKMEKVVSSSFTSRDSKTIKRLYRLKVVPNFQAGEG